MKMRIDWNEEWRFSSEYKEEMCLLEFDQESMEKVRLPHTVKSTPYNYFDSDLYEMVSGYRRIFDVPEEWQTKNVLITFEGAAHEASVYVNGIEAMIHRCGYTAFTIDLNEYLKYGQTNVITVRLDSRETLNQPPFGNVIDYMTYGGLYREVYLEVKERNYIQNVAVSVENVLDVTKILRCQITLHDTPESYIIQQSLLDIDGHEIIHFTPIHSDSASYGASDVELWTPENPKLYQLRTILSIDGIVMDQSLLKIGFRDAVFKDDGFYLNGKKYKLRGLNRHQSYPYVGYAMPERVQKRDVDLLINELGVNMVRTSHYPQSQHFLDACDEKGLLVFTEIPGWQHIGEEDWKAIAVKNVEEMVIQNRNHPSVVLWGVRINESLDDDKLYKKTNETAHQLDSSRQTSGVRYLQKSHLLEDVYAYNDFLHKGNNPGVSPKKKVTSNMKKGYLISEFNGHMFPTKMFDDESKRLEHALRTANVMNDYYKEEDIAGGCGWCMFDYNTHRGFGSGDRICYHGMMDMFRNTKLAAAVYKSQDERTPYLNISSEMDIGEHPACNIGTVIAFTNADQIRLYKNDEFVKEFIPDKEKGRYSNLPHPPILIDDFIGELMEKHEKKYSHRTCESMKEVLQGVVKYGMNDLPGKYKRKMAWLMMTRFISLDKATKLYGKYVACWGGELVSYRFEAWKDGKVMQTVTKSTALEKQLVVDVDTDVLVENYTYDVASVRFKMCDGNGNQLFYYQEPLKLEVSGDIELIGPDLISMKGGCFGTFVKSKGKSGSGQLKITTNEGETTVLHFTVLS